MRLFAISRQGLTAFAVFYLLPAVAQAQIEITLKKSFIEKYKDRVKIDADFVVDKAHKILNPTSKDGDMHLAGRSPGEIRLPIVAEIMNAAGAPSAVKTVQAAEGTGTAIPLFGVWRNWCDHAGGDQQTRGAPLETFDTTNPDHVLHGLFSAALQDLIGGKNDQ